MSSSIETCLLMTTSGALAVIFFFLAILTDAEYESPLTGFHRPKKALPIIFSILMIPFGILGLLFVIPFAFVFHAFIIYQSHRRQKDLKFSFELGQLTSMPCYQQLNFAAQNGSQEATQALEIFHDYRKGLEAQRAECLRNSEQARNISRSLHDLEHTHDWDDLPFEIPHIFDVTYWISKKRNELNF